MLESMMNVKEHIELTEKIMKKYIEAFNNEDKKESI